MKNFNYLYILAFLGFFVFGCNDKGAIDCTSCKIQEPDQEKSITFEHFKSDFDVYWDSEEKTASLALSKSKFSEEQKQNLFNSLDMDLYSEDIVSVSVYSKSIGDSMSLSSSSTMGLLIFSLDNGYLTARLFSNEQNELKKVVDSKVSFISTNGIVNAGDLISGIHSSTTLYSLAFIDYARVPKPVYSRPILSKLLETIKLKKAPIVGINDGPKYGCYKPCEIDPLQDYCLVIESQMGGEKPFCWDNPFDGDDEDDCSVAEIDERYKAIDPSHFEGMGASLLEKLYRMRDVFLPTSAVGNNYLGM